ncbi:hypothetical protein Celaphus_00002015, partial [Cervus elaphus hippelaphus]
MAWGPGPLTQSHPNTVAMPKRGKRLKFRAQDACSGRVTVVDYANSDLAIVPAVEALSGAGEPCDIIDSSGETGAQEESIRERTISRKKKSKRHREDLDGLEEKKCLDCHLHCCLLDEVVPKTLHTGYLSAFAPVTRVSEEAALFSGIKIIGNRQEPMWEFNCKFKKQSPRLKSKGMGGFQPPIQYKDVHNNPDQDCCLLQVTILNFIFIPIVMGMIFTLFTINVSTDSAASSNYPVRGGQKLLGEQGVRVILNPAHSIQLFDWWHPQYLFSLN